ncbi:LeuA family protein [Desulfonatronovibrio magnus]|uniref:LeuA family protein n=1 Tax=Desulfonatronovibrio magnus TaxID=698827 RepID=UPI0005EB6C5D|nr:hypothetical protein [Desulfonatronovibrio magnus]
MLIDTTLREGHQRFGLYMDLTARKKIMQMLDKVGVQEIEAGVAGRDNNLQELIIFARNLPHQPQISVWSPLREDCLSAAQSLGPDIINIGVPVSDLHLSKRLNLSRKELITRIKTIMHKSQNCDTHLSIGLEDFSRAEHDFALEVAHLFADAGGWRIRLSDSVGLLSPLEAFKAIKKFRQSLNIKLAFHGHNDFGMATANAVCALEAGCDFVDVSVLGIGERAGIARLEELVTWWNLKIKQTYNMHQLQDLCAYVAGLAGINIDAHSPVIGEKIFHVESGLHADGAYKAPELFEPFDPAILGHKRHISLGGKSGRNAVKAKISQLLLNWQDYNIEELTSQVRAKAAARGYPISDQTFLQMTKDQLSELKSCHE